MKYAIMSDVHANPKALETALADARAEMTMAQSSLIYAENVNHVTFEGFTLKGCRSDALVIRGEDNTVRRLTVYAVMGNAVVAASACRAATASRSRRVKTARRIT